MEKDKLKEEMKLINKILDAEEQIKKGKYTKVDSNTPIERIHDLLIK